MVRGKYLWLTKRRIEELIDVARVERAIEAAERLTSGEIRVSVAPWFWGSPERAADEDFARLGMTNTRERNGVLFFVVRGDEGIHERVGQTFWEDLADILSAYFRRGQLTEGLVAGISVAAEQLARHFPCDLATDVNELPNAIDLS